MTTAVCFNCVEDSYLKEIINDEGEPLRCSVCGEENNNAFTVEQLGKRIEPIMREHFCPAQGENGDSMLTVVQEVMRQDFTFDDEIVDAVIDSEFCRPGDGDEPFWNETSTYIEHRVKPVHYFAEWQRTLDELKGNRRFFSPAAKTLFGKLFKDVGNMKACKASGEKPFKLEPVMRSLPVGTELFRARICDSRSELQDFYKNPFQHVGPPPKNKPRPAGRMNAEGVAVFYGAMDEETCLAEMRPALTNEIAIITLETTAPLRILDFSLLERAHGTLSYFDPDYTEQVEKHAFLRHIHRLISQPVVPKREADYLITQAMSEYLAHVHQNPFDGILFASAQRENGTNIVLFAKPDLLTGSLDEAFSVSYIFDSIRLFSTTSIKYGHHRSDVIVGADKKLWIDQERGEEIGDEWIR
jgi:hypothetical protein